jgi:hypothetical protein
VIFIAILFLGLAYVWAKGDLDWVLAYSGGAYEPKRRGRRLKRAQVSEIEAAVEGEKHGDKHAAPVQPAQPEAV